MSLINDMLRDLDRRGVKNEAAHDDSGALEPALVNSERSGVGPLRVAVAFVLASLAVLLWHQWASAPVAAPEQAPMAPQEITIRPAPLTQPESIPAAAFEPEPEPERSAPETQELQQARISRLLAQAERALERDRLTLPRDDNAYARYGEILQLSPEHSEALAGIERIVGRYLELTEIRLARDDWASAQALLSRAQSINPNHPALAAMEQRIQTKQTAERTASVELQADTHSATGTRLEVTRNTAREDQRQSRQAHELVQQGRDREARMQLEQFLAAQPHSPYSSAELVSIYIDQGEIEAALAQLEQTELLSGEDTRLRARIDLAQGQAQRAIERLEAALAEAHENERYRALLAGLYYRGGYHAQAASAYRRLLDSFTAQPNYWLGLALALDAQQHSASAVEAYRRALSSDHYHTPDNREVRDYIEQRLAALNR